MGRKRNLDSVGTGEPEKLFLDISGYADTPSLAQPDQIVAFPDQD